MNNRDAIIIEADSHRLEFGENLHDSIMEAIYTDASRISSRSVTKKGTNEIPSVDRIIDRIVTSKWLGFPIMFLMGFNG